MREEEITAKGRKGATAWRVALYLVQRYSGMSNEEVGGLFGGSPDAKGFGLDAESGLLGHKNVETTMIYTHVLRELSNAPTSPLDALYTTQPSEGR